jgi:hypothetical protein
MADDRKLLIDTLTGAVKLYDEKIEGHTLLTQPSPDEEVLKPIEIAIEGSDAYRAVSGQVLFSANSGVIIQSSSLAIDLLHRAQRNPDEAADWFIRMLGTRKANASLKAAIWGLSIDQEIDLFGTAKLMPFDALPDSDMKQRVVSRARTPWDNSAWIAQSFYDMPQAAYAMPSSDFPYIGKTSVPFETFEAAVIKAQRHWAFLEGIAVGHPIAVGYWFEYDDVDLDLASYENTLSWSVPEIAPHIKTVTKIDSKIIADDVSKFAALPDDVRKTMFRSIKRFALSQCRREDIDRVLDLVLAYEIIASSGGGDNVPASWKVSVRPAQLIGGDLAKRQETRKHLAALYSLRSQATHGGSLAAVDKQVVEKACEIYRVLLRSLLRLGTKPDWRAIEIESPFDQPIE